MKSFATLRVEAAALVYGIRPEHLGRSQAGLSGQILVVEPTISLVLILRRASKHARGVRYDAAGVNVKDRLFSGYLPRSLRSWPCPSL